MKTAKDFNVNDRILVIYQDNREGTAGEKQTILGKVVDHFGQGIQIILDKNIVLNTEWNNNSEYNNFELYDGKIVFGSDNLTFENITILPKEIIINIDEFITINLDSVLVQYIQTILKQAVSSFTITDEESYLKNKDRLKTIIDSRKIYIKMFGYQWTDESIYLDKIERIIKI